MISGKTRLLLTLLLPLWASTSASETRSVPAQPAVAASSAVAASASSPGVASSSFAAAPAAAAADVVTAKRLIAALGQPAPAHTAFAEARFMQMLDRPLLVSGELSWLGGDKLQRHTVKPHQETATIADGKVTLQREGKRTRHFSLSRAPQLEVLLDSFVALLSGDSSRLEQAFTIRFSGAAEAAWTLRLIPRDEKVAQTIASITVDGYGGQSRCMSMAEADGDLAVDLLGPLAAKMPAQPTREALKTLCQSAP